MRKKQYFDEVAHQWDEMRKTFFSSVVRERAISVAEVQPERLAADVGAGTGFITQGLVQRGLRVIAVDQSGVMIREMRKRFRGVEAVDCRVGEAERLPIGDEFVDYVFANMLLHHVENPSVAIREMVRILKPSGVVVVTDLDEHDFDFLRTEHHDLWMGFKRDDVKRWFTDAGLKDVTVECVGENCCARSVCGDKYANIGIFVASGKK